MKLLLKILLPIAIVAFGLLGTVALVRSKPQIEAEKPVPVLPLVRVVVVEKHDVPLAVKAQGTVLPRTETTLAAQVAAQVVAVAPAFEVGGFFARGTALVTLDPRDFELAIEQAKARVAQATVRLARQEAEARVAREEWRRLGEGEPGSLVLREPQIAEARAAVAAAEAEFARARLDLERTRIRAPFRGRVRRKHVDLGQYLTPGQGVAQVHAIDYAEVRLPIPHHELAFLDLPLAYHDGDAPPAGPRVTLAADFTGRRHAWQGRIVRTEGELDSRSRMLHLVARVEDPYGRGTDPERPPLAVGLFVEAEIAGRTVPQAVLLPRSALRDEAQVLVVDDEDRLRFRRVEVARLHGDAVIVGGGLEAGERVCVSPLDVVVDGMRVRTTVVEGVPAPAAVSQPAGDGDAPPPAPPAPSPAASRLLSVDVVRGEGAVFRLAVDGEFAHSSFRLREPDRVVIDLEGVVDATRRSVIQVGALPVLQVRVAQFAPWPEAVSRVVFDLQEFSPPEIERTASGLTVRFRAGPAPAPPPEE